MWEEFRGQTGGCGLRSGVWGPERRPHPEAPGRGQEWGRAQRHLPRAGNGVPVGGRAVPESRKPKGAGSCAQGALPSAGRLGGSVFRLLQGGRTLSYVVSRKAEKLGQARGEGRTYQHAHTLTLPPPRRPCPSQSQLPEKGSLPGTVGTSWRSEQLRSWLTLTGEPASRGSSHDLG